jgi:3-deoxy-manno-octulosonate cytidylyltransferase (CMP-KDO synthetase)
VNPRPAPRAIAIVPVRVGSHRLPGKALLRDSGKELFLHTCDRALQARNLDGVFVATDDDAVDAAARRHGVAVLRTSPRPRTGSERCAEAAAELACDVVVDIQGDWPEVDPADLEALTAQLLAGDAACNTLATPLRDDGPQQDPNVVKVVRGGNGKALYFSRAPIPFMRPGDGAAGGCQRLRHIGVYGFDKATLLRIPDLPSSGLAETEGLEQLRFLENDIPMHVLMASGDPWGIETRADYDAFLRRLRS